jgi:hypothetical protein
MDIVRQVIVFDAADPDAESTFWAGMLGAHVFRDDRFHSVIDASGEWRVGVQLAPDHVPPEWPDRAPQQLHLDLHVDDPRAAHEVAVGLGARLLRAGDSTPRTGTKRTPTRPGTRSASAGGTRLGRQSPPSSPVGCVRTERREGLGCVRDYPRSYRYTFVPQSTLEATSAELVGRERAEKRSHVGHGERDQPSLRRVDEALVEQAITLDRDI